MRHSALLFVVAITTLVWCSCVLANVVYISPNGSDSADCGAAADAACSSLEYALLQRTATEIRALPGNYSVDMNIIQQFIPAQGSKLSIIGVDLTENISAVRFVPKSSELSRPLFSFQAAKASCISSISIQNVEFNNFFGVMEFLGCNTTNVELRRTRFEKVPSGASAVTLLETGGSTNITISQSEFVNSFGSFLTVQSGGDTSVVLQDTRVSNNSPSDKRSLILIEALASSASMSLDIVRCNMTDNVADWMLLQADLGMLLSYRPSLAKLARMRVVQSRFERNALYVGLQYLLYPSKLGLISANILVQDGLADPGSVHSYEFEQTVFSDCKMTGSFYTASSTIVMQIGQPAQSNVLILPKATISLVECMFSNNFLQFFGDVTKPKDIKQDVVMSAGPVLDLLTSDNAVSILRSRFEGNMMNDISMYFVGVASGAFGLSLNSQTWSHASVTLFGSSFTNNNASISSLHARCSGAVAIKSITSPRNILDLTVNGCFFDSNAALAVPLLDRGIGYANGGALSLDVICSTQALITASNFANNRAESYGGSIYVNAPIGQVQVFDVTIRDSTAKGHGGSLYVARSEVNVNSTLIQNSVSQNGYGGAVCFINVPKLKFTGNTMLNSVSMLGGGGMYIASTDKDFERYDLLRVENSTIIGAIAQSGDGGAILGVDLPFIFDKLVIRNASAQRGGALALQAEDSLDRIKKSIRIYYSDFSYCSASQDGGCVYVGHNQIQIIMQDTKMRQGNAKGTGGILYSLSESFLISDSQFIEGTSGVNGGCLSVRAFDAAFSVVSSCRAQQHGGAIYFHGPVEFSSRIFRSSIDSSTAVQGNGGAISCDSNNYCNVESTTISQCQAPNGLGGGIYCSSTICSLNELSMLTNSARNGGHVALRDPQPKSTIADGDLQFGSAQDFGGAVFVEGLSNSDTAISTTKFQHNWATFGGSVAVLGASSQAHPSLLADTSNSFVNSAAELAGGVIFASLESQFRCNMSALESQTSQSFSRRGYGPLCASEASRVVWLPTPAFGSAFVSGHNLSTMAVSVLDAYGQPVLVDPTVQRSSRYVLPSLKFSVKEDDKVLLEGGTKFRNMTNVQSVDLGQIFVYGDSTSLGSQPELMSLR